MGSVATITVTSGGTAYTSAPTVNFTGGAGSGAEAIAVVQDGAVVRVVITNVGSGYTSAPSIAFSSGAAAATATIEDLVVLDFESSLDRTILVDITDGVAGKPDAGFIAGATTKAWGRMRGYLPRKVTFDTVAQNPNGTLFGILIDLTSRGLYAKHPEKLYTPTGQKHPIQVAYEDAIDLLKRIAKGDADIAELTDAAGGEVLSECRAFRAEPRVRWGR